MKDGETCTQTFHPIHFQVTFNRILVEFP